ncbi:hypothetical protein ACFQ6B_36300 [Streptomyces wedmorensis]|uniref:Uncharacterized protein n=1 Tax=Streptomyces wedmorensis TaxID=43759 RepID=A0ABW6IRE5_STRWE|nr:MULTISPECIES: hypothetical protein [Streptomyces]
MATPERAEPGRDHVPMSELLASCAAARALSTPPPQPSEQTEEDTVRDEAA